MSADPVPVKTPEGQAELGTRRLRLSQRHRTVLLLIDGRRTESEVRHLARQAGVPANCFDELLGLSLIARPEAFGLRPADAPPGAPGPARSSAAGTAAPFAPEAGARISASRPSAPIPRVVIEDSLLPASGTLAPDSSRHDSIVGGAPPPGSWLPPESDDDEAPAPIDLALEQAREILLRIVRADAPLAGSLTLLRLKRARSRGDLALLIEDVAGRIGRRHRSLAAAQSLASARHLLATPGVSPALSAA